MNANDIDINPGRYRHKIRIQNKNISNDIEGIPTDEWKDYAAFWSSFEAVNGSKYFNAAASSSQINTVFYIRYPKKLQIDATMRVVYLGKNYNIKYVIDTNGEHRELQLACMEEIQNG
jgi:SPP1 family predicted phage head-tail adaptor